jgi:uncharacterized RDD family membrane protein YckC
VSTPHGGEDPNTGWSSPGPADAGGAPPGPPPGYPPPGQQGYPPPGQDYGQPDYSQVQPHYGQPMGQVPRQLAGFWIRFGGAFVDGILLAIAQSIVGAAVGEGLGNLIGIVMGAAYFVYFHSTTGQTLGNKLVKIKVIDQASGDTIDGGRAFVRYLVSWVSAIPVTLGYLWMLWDSDKQTWHDKAAKTIVVKVT